MNAQVERPDQMAVNGPAAWRAFVNWGYPRDRLVPVEALRFLGLTQPSQRTASDRARSRGSGKGQGDRPLLGLILGDVVLESTRKLLRVAEGATRLLPGRCTFTFKPHPVLFIDPHDDGGGDIKITDEALPGILQSFDFVFTSNTTSGALEAYLEGLQVIVHLDQSRFNFSPLREREDVIFVSTPQSLADVVASPPVLRTDRERGEFFWLDRNLPRWRELISRCGISMEDEQVHRQAKHEQWMP